MSKNFNLEKMNEILLLINDMNLSEKLEEEDLNKINEIFEYFEGKEKLFFYNEILNNGNINTNLLNFILNNLNNIEFQKKWNFFIKSIKEKVILQNQTFLILKINEIFLNNENSNSIENNNNYLEKEIINQSIKNLFLKKYENLKEKEKIDFLKILINFFKNDLNCLKILIDVYYINNDEKIIKIIIDEILKNEEYKSIVWKLSNTTLTKLSEKNFNFFQFYSFHLLDLLNNDIINYNHDSIKLLLNSNNLILNNLSFLIFKKFQS
jgi:hypothetical protein